MRNFILASLFISLVSLADTPPPGAVKIKGNTDGTLIGNVVDSQKVNVTNTIALPTGAATAALQTSGNASLSSIDLKIPASPSQEHVSAASFHSARLTDGTTFYKATTPSDTQPISVSSLPLPSGAATAANQTTANASLSSIDSKLTSPVTITGSVGLSAGSNTIGKVDQGIGGVSAWKVDGSAVTQPVSAASLPLPTGAATSALQTSGNASLASIDSKLTAPLSVTGPLTDTQLRATPVPISGTVTSNAGTNLNTSALALSATQTNGTQKTQVVDGAGTVVAVNYGSAANAIRTAAQIGNATAVADFNSGAVSAQTLRVSPATDVTQMVQNRVIDGTGTGTALNQTPIPDTDASMFQCLRFQMTGTHTSTLALEASDDGTNWLAVFFKDLNTATAVPVSTVANTGGASVFVHPINTKRVRLRVSAFTSGTSTITYQFSSLPCSDHKLINNVNVNGSVATTLSSGTLTSQASALDVAAAARTTTFTSGTLNPSQGGMSTSFALSVTAVSGTTPTMDCVIQETNDTATTWYDIYHFERVTAATTLNTPMMRVDGNRRRHICTIAGTTPSFTFSINAINSQTPSQLIKRFFNRTVDPNTLASSTPSFYVEGCQQHALFVNMAAGGTAPTFTLQLSEDGTNWANTATTIVGTVNSTTVSPFIQAMGKFSRLNVTTAGVASTLGSAMLRCEGK